MTTAQPLQTPGQQYLDRLLRQIEQERDEERGKRTILDTDRVRPLQHELAGLVRGAAGRLDSDAPEGGAEAHAVSIEVAFESIDGLIALRSSVSSRSRLYSAEAIELSQRTHGLQMHVRQKAQERLGTSPLAQEARTRFGVGSKLDPDGVQDVYDAGVQMLEGLTKPELQELFERRGFLASRHASRLDPLLTELKTEIAEGVGAGARKGETGEELNAAYNQLEISLERAANFLEDYGATEDARKLRGRLPRRRSGRRAPASAPGTEQPGDLTQDDQLPQSDLV